LRKWGNFFYFLTLGRCLSPFPSFFPKVRANEGNPWLCRLLLQAAHVVARQKQGYLAAQFRRIAARRGKKRAGMAVAHSILVIIYHLLRKGVPYEEHGDAFFEERDRELAKKRLVHQLERLGHQVTLQPLAQVG
jgi:transposase